MATKLVLTALKHVWATLEPIGCPCALMGGLSLSFWQHVRNTQDVDLLIDPSQAGIDSILDVLNRAGVRTKRRPPVMDLGSVRLVQLLWEPKNAFMDVQIDRLLAESAFHREAISRRIPVHLPDVVLDLFTLSCEDILLLKLTAGRLIDRADAAALVRLNRDTLDLPYLLGWVSRLNLDSDWAGVWAEAFPGEPQP
jgi:hypothetical protein